MVNQFRQVVSAYINQNSEEKNWEEIRRVVYGIFICGISFSGDKEYNWKS